MKKTNQKYPYFLPCFSNPASVEIIKLWESRGFKYRPGKGFLKTLTVRRLGGHYMALDMFDHPGSLVNIETKEILPIIEPYSINPKEKRELMAFCRERGFTPKFTKDSPWNPPSTTMVIFMKGKVL